MSDLSETIQEYRAFIDTTETTDFLSRMSRHATNGDLSGTMITAVEYPVQSRFADGALIVHRTTNDESYHPIASANVPHSLLSNFEYISQHKIIQHVIASLTPCILDKIQFKADRLIHMEDAEQIVSMACLPIVTTGYPALLLYFRDSPRGFHHHEMSILCTIANNIGSAFLNASHEERHLVEHNRHTHEQIHYQDALFDLNSSSANISTILNVAVDEILTTLNADSGSVMLYEYGACRIAASRGLSQNAAKYADTNDSTAVHRRIIAGRKPIMLHGPVDEKAFPGASPRPEIISSLSIPLRGKHRIIGVLNVNSTSKNRCFDDIDMNTLLPMANHIAVTVENSKLRDAAKAQARHMGNLYKIARTITSTLELSTVLTMIRDRLSAMVPSDVSALILWNEELSRFEFGSGHGIPDAVDGDYVKLILSTARLSSTASHRVVIHDLKTHRAYPEYSYIPRLGLRSAVIVPLIIRRKTVGYLATYSRHVNGFPAPTVRLLSGISELAAIAIGNALLYERQTGIASITRRELLPRQNITIPNFEIGHKYAPAHQVGGDYYEVINLSDHKFAIAIADVTGKDIQAAAYISVCKHSLKALAPHIQSPTRLLREMNRIIYDATGPESFISMFYGVLDTKTHHFTYANAGHEPALLWKARTRSLRLLHAEGILLGVLPDATFTEVHTSIDLGDVLLLYTDGLIEAIETVDDTGLDLLGEILTQHSLLSAQSIADNIHELAVATLPSRASDDIALLVLKTRESELT